MYCSLSCFECGTALQQKQAVEGWFFVNGSVCGTIIENNSAADTACFSSRGVHLAEDCTTRLLQRHTCSLLSTTFNSTALRDAYIWCLLWLGSPAYLLPRRTADGSWNALDSVWVTLGKGAPAGKATHTGLLREISSAVLVVSCLMLACMCRVILLHTVAAMLGVRLGLSVRTVLGMLWHSISFISCHHTPHTQWEHTHAHLAYAMPCRPQFASVVLLEQGAKTLVGKGPTPSLAFFACMVARHSCCVGRYPLGPKVAGS